MDFWWRKSFHGFSLTIFRCIHTTTELSWKERETTGLSFRNFSGYMFFSPCRQFSYIWSIISLPSSRELFGNLAIMVHMCALCTQGKKLGTRWGSNQRQFKGAAEKKFRGPERWDWEYHHVCHSRWGRTVTRAHVQVLNTEAVSRYSLPSSSVWSTECQT